MRVRVFALLLTAFCVVFAEGGPPGGAISDLVVAADDPTVMFASTNAGVYVSNTSGQTWVEANGGLPRLDVGRITGNSEVQFVAVREDGVYRSRNDEAWEFAGDGLQGNDILAVEMSPSDPNILYAGSATGRIFKSLNGGEGWISASHGLAEGVYFEITASPTEPGRLLASNISAEDRRGRLFRTSNGGDSWEEVFSGPITISGVAFAENAPGTVWVATGAGLFMTTDFWESLTGPIFGLAQFQDVAVSATDSQVVYATVSDGNVIRTSDGGQEWVSISGGLPRAVSTRVELTEQSVFVGLSGSGVYRSDDAGESWRISSAGMHAANVMAISVDPWSAGSVLASSAGGGMFKTATAGKIWSESRDGLRAFQVTSMQHDPANPRNVYAGTINPFLAGDGSLFKSSDGGRSWQALFAQRPVFDVATHPTDSQTVWVGSQTDQFFGDPGMLLSTDGGTSFNLVSGGRGELQFLDVLVVQVDQADPRRVYAIVRDPFSFTTTYQFVWTEDGGDEWFGSAPTALPITALGVDPSERRRVLIGTIDGLFRSSNGGGDFGASVEGLPTDFAVVVNRIVFAPNDDNAVYAATSAGVFKSVTGGESWTSANRGLERFLLRQLVVDPSAPGHLYAATVGGGVFSSVDAGANWVPTGGIAALSSAGVVNAATFEARGIAPGEIVSLFVQNAGPEVGVAATAFDPETGKLPTTLAGVRVFFDDVPAALFFVRRDQLNVQAPFEIAGEESVDVRVEYEGAPSGVIAIKVREADPGLFSPVLNQDFSLNSEANTAARGSVVQLFATGQGTVSPQLMSGAPAPGVAPLPVPDLAVKVFVNDQEATVLFAGLTPGLVGLMQINVQLPANLSGTVTIRLQIGELESPTVVTVHVG